MVLVVLGHGITGLVNGEGVPQTADCLNQEVKVLLKVSIFVKSVLEKLHRGECSVPQNVALEQCRISHKGEIVLRDA